MKELTYAIDFLNREKEQLEVTLKFAPDYLIYKLRNDLRSIEFAIKLLTNKREVMK